MTRPMRWCTSRKGLKRRRSRKQVCEVRAESEASLYRSFVVHISISPNYNELKEGLSQGDLLEGY